MPLLTTKEENESIEYIFKTNNYHTKVFKDWLERSINTMNDQVINDSSMSNRELDRKIGNVQELKNLLKRIDY